MEDVLARQLNTVYRLALAQARNKADAEDIAQTVFLEYVRRRPVFENETHEKAWFVRVTLHRARNLFQSAARRKAAVFEPGRHGKPAGEELGGDIHVALLSLPVETRALLTLRYAEQMDAAHIAELLGMSEPAVRKRLQRGRDKLRKILGGDV